jgi:hypothetical protein
MTNAYFVRKLKLSHNDRDCLGNLWFSCPLIMDFISVFKRIENKVNVGLVLSVV